MKNVIQNKVVKVFYVLSVLVFALQMAGCATRTQTTVTSTNQPVSSSTTTTTTTEPGNGTTQTTVTDSSQPTTVVEKTTTTDHSDDGGVFGGAFHFLGEVLAFPFRVIGAAFDALF